MHISPRGHGLVDLSQEFQELLCPMARHAITDDRARFHVQRCEQCGRAMALVIVRYGRGTALLERQSGLGPVGCLDLRLFVNAEHDRPVGRIEVKPDDIGDLLLELWVIRDFEPLCEMRFRASFRLYAADARWRNAHGFGHQRPARVRCIGWGFLHRLGDHLQPCFHGQRRHTRGARLIALEPRHAFIQIPRLTAPDRRLRHAGPPHDLEGAMAAGRRQHDPGPPDKLARRVAVDDQHFKLSAVGGGQGKGRYRSFSCPEYDTP